MTVVVGLAPDGRGRAVLDVAGMLARSAEDDLFVCTVVTVPWPPGSAQVESEYRRFLDGMAQAVLERTRERLPSDVAADSVVHHARSAPAGLVEVAELREAAMIVVGTSGYPAIGSVTARLLHGSPVPVALAPHGFRSRPADRVERVTAAFGGAEGLVDAAAAVGARLGAPLRIASFAVHAHAPFAAGHIERSVQEIETVAGHAPAVVGHGASWEEAIEDIEWRDGDVLVVGSSSAAPAARVFLGSRASRIIRHAPVPVIVVPRQPALVARTGERWACDHARMPTFKPGGCLGLVLHPRTDPTPVLEKLTTWARASGKRVIVDAREAARVPSDVEPVSEAELVDRADALISLGGDGTMLGALRLVAHRPVPVLGVNLGNLGFLVEIEPDELDDALDRLEKDDYTIEEHSAAVLTDEGDESIAFNDIALASVPGEGAVHASLTVNGRPSGQYRCDALVMATPIGSTAYSYAAGGPLVSPMLDAVIVSPVAPIAGISRAAVISAAEPIELALLDASGHPVLQVDGTIRRRMQPGETLELRLRLRAGLVVRLDPERYQRRSGVKLSLLDLPFLPEEMRDLLPGRDPVGLTLDT